MTRKNDRPGGRSRAAVASTVRAATSAPSLAHSADNAATLIRRRRLLADLARLADRLEATDPDAAALARAWSRGWCR